MDAWIDVAPGFAFQQWAQERQRPGWLPDRGQTLVLHAGSHRLVADVIVPQDVELRFEAGAVIVGRVNLTLHGRIVAAEETIFDVASGLRVRMVGRQTPQVTPQWWGVRGNGRPGDGAKLAAMAASIVREDSPSVVAFPPGVYVLEQTAPLPPGKRYLGQGAPGEIVFRRYDGFLEDVPLCLCRCDSAEARRVTFKGLTFDGAGVSAPLLRVTSTPSGGRFEASVIDCAFTGSGAAALEVEAGEGLHVDGCRFDACRVAVSATGIRGHASMRSMTSTSKGGDVVLQGVEGSVVTVAESELSGRIVVTAASPAAWDVRISDTGCAGVEVDAPGSRLGVCECRLRGSSLDMDTVLVRAARQVVVQGCRVGVPTGEGKRFRVGLRVRWRFGMPGAVLFYDCVLAPEPVDQAGATAIEITDDGGEGLRRVDVIASSVGAGLGLAARIIGARASFRQLSVQSAAAFRLEAGRDGAGSEVTVAALQYMPVRALRPGPYLQVEGASGRGTPHRLRHEDVIVESEFNQLAAAPSLLAAVQIEGERLIRGPAQLADARPVGLSGLVGDHFRPRDLLQDARNPGWPTEWWCVRSGVGDEAIWQPVCQ